MNKTKKMVCAPIATLTLIGSLIGGANAAVSFSETFTSTSSVLTNNPGDWDNTWTIGTGNLTHQRNNSGNSVAEIGAYNAKTLASSDFSTISGTLYSFTLDYDNYSTDGTGNLDVVFIDIVSGTELSRTTFNIYNGNPSTDGVYGVDLSGGGLFTATSTTTRIVLDTNTHGHGWTMVDNIKVASVPEASSAFLLGFGSMSLVLRRHRIK